MPMRMIIVLKYALFMYFLPSVYAYTSWQYIYGKKTFKSDAGMIKRIKKYFWIFSHLPTLGSEFEGNLIGFLKGRKSDLSNIGVGEQHREMWK